MAKEAKTNAMRMLDRQKVKYEAFPYECDEFIDGVHIADMLSQGRVQPCDFLKVPHHGVYNSKLEDYFSKVNMKYAVITCSDKNPAEQKTLDLLTAKGCRTFLTSNGTVRIRSTKSGIDITQ